MPARGRQDLETLQGFFDTAHQEWQESQTTIAGAVFQLANQAYQSAVHGYQNETVEAITNLATATASYCASVAAFTETNSALIADCTDSRVACEGRGR